MKIKTVRGIYNVMLFTVSFSLILPCIPGPYADFLPAQGLIYAQVILGDMLVNDHQMNTVGVWRPRIAVAPDGSFAVLWEDYNDRPGINFNSAGRSQIAVQRFSAEAQPLEGIHFFQGESTLISMWFFDYLEHAELAYLSTGELLLLMQHAGRFVIDTDDVPSSEVTIGAINANGQIIKLSNNSDNVQYTLGFATSTRQYLPRLAVTPQNLIVAILDEKSSDSDFRNIAFRALDTSFSEVITREVPHSDGVGTAPHSVADIATNGQLFSVVWQDGRHGDLWSVSVQFYNQQGPVGGNFRMNQSEPGTAYALAPSVAMNSSGRSVAAWFDSRNGAQLFGQQFDETGTPSGGNFQISETPPGGDIYSRPELAMREDGSFMVVWTDSTQVPGYFRARARQFDAAGNPAGQPFMITSSEWVSGRPHITTDGTSYYCTWLDDRQGTGVANVYMNVIGNVSTSTATETVQLPARNILHQNYPNPFNPSTTIRFELAGSSQVKLSVTDILGREISVLVHEHLSEGTHTVTFSADHLPTGLYLMRLQIGNQLLSGKMMLMK